MVALDKKYREKGLEILAFPCNQFGGQEPKPEEEIKKFVTDKFNVEFNMFSKVEVNGDNTDEVFQFLKKCFPGDITWNFATKWVIDRTGKPVARFEKESWEEIEQFLVEQMEQK